MIVAIHQPNYLPWLGLFYKMANCDVFVFLDDALHSKSSFTNRNKIKTREGTKLLSVPLSTKEVKINELTICNDQKWQLKHWNIIENSYSQAPYWEEYSVYFREILTKKSWTYLSELNIALIWLIKGILGIKTEIITSSMLKISNHRGSERNLAICKYLDADIYLSGEGARSYNDEESFEREGIKLVYTRFQHPVYHQLWGDFVPNLSIIDLLFNEGEKSLPILREQRCLDFALKES